MQKTINGATLRKMLVSSYSLLEENKNNVDALNVFPVPDGDTGTNMTLTLKSAVAEMNACESNSIEALSVAFNRGALKGARGNSGVILSQIIRGLATGVDKDIITDNQILSAVGVKRWKHIRSIGKLFVR
jgi:dihydroxyacetone kinase-like predicted kinase